MDASVTSQDDRTNVSNVTLAIIDDLNTQISTMKDSQREKDKAAEERDKANEERIKKLEASNQEIVGLLKTITAQLAIKNNEGKMPARAESPPAGTPTPSTNTPTSPVARARSEADMEEEARLTTPQTKGGGKRQNTSSTPDKDQTVMNLESTFDSAATEAAAHEARKAKAHAARIKADLKLKAKLEKIERKKLREKSREQKQRARSRTRSPRGRSPEEGGSK